MGIIDPTACHSLIEEFTLGRDVLAEMAESFRDEMTRGLSHSGRSSLRMLKSYIGLPTGNETGEYLALDFGGTNLRVLRILLEGQGKYKILKKVARPLRVEGEYDYIGAGSEAETLFDFIAVLVDEAIEGNRTDRFFLGHTFSFPSSQTSLRDATLISWTKEFATGGVEGRAVNELLRLALEHRGIKNVLPVAVINDTVAVLLSAAYRHGETFIGSIYATGHNTCYFEPEAEAGEAPMIRNLESGNFDIVPQNRFDMWLDAHSEKPGEQLLEKMVAGRYMGELFGLALAELLGEKGKVYPFTSVDISEIIKDETDDLLRAGKILNAKMTQACVGQPQSHFKSAAILSNKTQKEFALEDVAMARELAAAIVVRSARLVGASFSGILGHMGKNKETRQHIAVDGSVYEKMPLVKENIRATLRELLGAAGDNIDTILENGGSGLGAAIAAAMAEK
ncbi:MAG: hypothetical protein IJV18_06250 [Acidaminococcaceae bacterium]|nr:hypothetical protein [Acidaminococcaceae bacterium]MBQ9256497.1 hypothetical protein [Acidaminococcaceae bacterium]